MTNSPTPRSLEREAWKASEVRFLASEVRFLSKQENEHREAWISHHVRLAEVHNALAREHRGRVGSLLDMAAKG